MIREGPENETELSVQIQAERIKLFLNIKGSFYTICLVGGGKLLISYANIELGDYVYSLKKQFDGRLSPATVDFTGYWETHLIQVEIFILKRGMSPYYQNAH